MKSNDGESEEVDQCPAGSGRVRVQPEPVFRDPGCGAGSNSLTSIDSVDSVDAVGAVHVVAG